MTVLNDLYASGGAEIRIPCLSFRCSEWDYVHFCEGFEDITATLETSESVTFIATDFAVQLAERSESGNQSIEFSIGATDDVLEKIDLAIEAGAKVYVDYREYLLSDLTEPARPVESLTVMPYTYDNQTNTISFSAGYNDFVNRSWPRNRYTAAKFPGLEFFGS